MDTEKEFTIIIKRLSRGSCGPDGSYAFTGAKAVYNDKQKLYRESGIEYEFRAKSITALENISLGDIYKVTAKEVLDPAHGYQWQIIAAEQIEPAGVQEIRRFMMQLREKSITPKRCDILLKAYGAKTLDIILADRSALDILNVDPGIADRIYFAIKENRSFASLLRFLEGRRWGCRLALQLYEKYKNDALSKLRTNPYILYWDEIASFRTADGIFLSDGGKTDSPQRCQNLIKAVLHEEEVRNGSLFISREELNGKIDRLVDDGSPFDYTLSESDISKTLSWLKECDKIHIDHVDGKEYIYPSQLYHAETDVAEGLRALCQAKKSVTCPVDEIDQFLDKYETAVKVQLTPNQRAAVKRMLTAPVSILTGGPGTGKTLLVKVAIEALHELHSRAVVQCCALTGKAAACMPEGACTINSLINSGNYTHKRNPDIFFVDEASMVDIERFAKLLTVIPTGARLVLIGDQDQLPSIEAGQVLRDLINSGVIHTVQLQEVFRQKDGSDIRSSSEKIIKTAPDQDIHLDEKGEGFVFNTHIGSPHRIVDAVLDTYERLLKNGNPPETIQIIPWRKYGEVGALNINYLVQERFNHQDEENEVIYNGKEFRLRDRVIHVKNNYKLKVYNGETGIITEICHTKERALTVKYPSKTIQYAEKDLKQLELAYALNVHKCQGSEYNIVIIPIVGRGISRRMLYTAVTRGRQLVLMIGTESALTAGMRGETSDERASRLVQRLRKFLPPILPEVEQMSLFPSAQDGRTSSSNFRPCA